MASLRTVFCKDLFAGKVAIVTGGGSGIGKAITTELARLGCKVVIASRKAERLQESAKEINHTIADEVGGATETPRPRLERVYPFQCNIRQEDQVRLDTSIFGKCSRVASLSRSKVMYGSSCVDRL